MKNMDDQYSKKFKVGFIGSGYFGIPILDKILDSKFYELKVVITQPDKPTGRYKQLEGTDISKFLDNKNFKLTILKPYKIKDLESELKQINLDLLVVASYGQIIPEKIINLPKLGSVNFHGSLLPKFRGAVPVQMAILQGCSTTGVTLQKMTFEMDAGDIIAQRMISIDKDDTTESLMKNLGDTASLMVDKELLDYLQNPNFKLIQQNHSLATYCYKSDIDKSKAQITFEKPFELVERMVRAFFPWPIAWVLHKKYGMIKIFKIGEFVQSESETSELHFIKKNKKLYMQIKEGIIEVIELQAEGKKRDNFKNYFFLVD